MPTTPVPERSDALRVSALTHILPTHIYINNKKKQNKYSNKNNTRWEITEEDIRHLYLAYTRHMYTHTHSYKFNLRGKAKRKHNLL